MSRSSRIVLAAARLAFVAAAINLVSILVPPSASAVLGDCGQPVTNGPSPTATDCLFILQASVSLAVCNPECICAPRGTLPVSATDALICLNVSVGQPATLDCPCGSSSTTSTTLDGGGTTTTTTTLGGDVVACSFDSSTCVADPCTCGGVLDGFDYHLVAAGQVSGPLGTQLRVNISVAQGGLLDCGDWTRIDASVNASCDTIGCCERQSGNPETSAWSAGEAIDLPCFCPGAPGPLQHNYLIQCQLGSDPVVEHEQTTSPCP
jgi:hypothetical protein